MTIDYWAIASALGGVLIIAIMVWIGVGLDSPRMVKFMFLQYPAKIAGGDYEPDIAQ
jgi:hypothetical protein